MISQFFRSKKQASRRQSISKEEYEIKQCRKKIHTLEFNKEKEKKEVVRRQSIIENEEVECQLLIQEINEIDNNINTWKSASQQIENEVARRINA